MLFVFRGKVLVKLKFYEKSERGVLATLTFSHLAQHFHAGLSVLYTDIMFDLNMNYIQLGVMTGTTRIISGFLQIVWSILSRYFSRRLLLGFGNILTSIGCLIIGRSQRFIEITFGNIVSGSGQAAPHPIGTSIIANKFQKGKVAGALSIFYGLGYIGNIISPIILSAISLSIGWRQAIFFLVLIPLITGINVLYYLKSDPSASRSIQKEEPTHLLSDVKSAIHVKGALLILAAQGFAVGGTGMGIIITYTPLFLRNILKIGIFETSIIYSIAVAGGVIGTIMFGHMANKYGNLKTVATIIGICSILILLLTFYHSFNLFILFHLFLIGTTSFASSSLLQAHLSSISTPRQRDILIGLFFTVGFGISSVWTTIAGFLIDIYQSFNPVWILRSFLGIIAFFILMCALYKNSSK